MMALKHEIVVFIMQGLGEMWSQLSDPHEASDTVRCVGTVSHCVPLQGDQPSDSGFLMPCKMHTAGTWTQLEPGGTYQDPTKHELRISY